MDHLSFEELKGIAQAEGEYSVSIFMPTHRMGNQTQQDPIRFGNLLRELELRLLEMKRRPNVEAFLERAKQLLDDGEFWRFQQEGLAVYFNQNEFHAYPLPYAVEERLVLGDRFFLLPVLPLFTGNGHFFVLAVSQNQARLFEATRNSVSEVALRGLPQSMDDVHGDRENQRNLQGRTSGGGAYMVHGHGGGGEVERMRIAQYLNELDKGLQPLLRPAGVPLVIAAVELLRPIYHEVTNYSNVVEKGPDGNPELLRADEVHAEAWPFVEEYFRAEIEQAIERYGTLAAQERGSNMFEPIVAAAYTGRVDTLLLRRELELWGLYDAATNSVRRLGDGSAPAHNDPGAEHALELASFAAGQTLLNGGVVYMLGADELPAGVEALAIYRY